MTRLAQSPEKRRAELIARREWFMKAEVRNVLPRDRTAFLLEFLQGTPEIK